MAIPIQTVGETAGEGASAPARRYGEFDHELRPFIHLRVHSAYSLLEGALPLAKIVDHAVRDQAPAIAVTDTNNLFGALEFAQKAVKEGVQPIVGCQADLSFGHEGEEAQRSHHRRAPEPLPVVLIAATEAGYGNLVRLVSRMYLETPPGERVQLPVAALDGLGRRHHLPHRRRAGTARRGAQGRSCRTWRRRDSRCSSGCSATGSMSSFRAPKAIAGGSRPAWWISPTGTTCPWWRPTRRSSRRGRTTRRMTR